MSNQNINEDRLIQMNSKKKYLNTKIKRVIHNSTLQSLKAG